MKLLQVMALLIFLLVLLLVFDAGHVDRRERRSLLFGIENVTPDLLTRVCPEGNVHCPAAIFTNQTGVTRDGRRSIDVLLHAGVNLKKIFAPEHGLTGSINHNEDQRQQVGVDVSTQLPVYTLHTYTVKELSKDLVDDIDLIFFDIQDSGMRHFTYITSLLKTLEAAAAYNKTVVVLDRPNPLGRLVEGPLVDEGYFSAISVAAIPVRHGLTLAEVANYFNTYVLEKPARLFVCPMRGYGPDHADDHFLAPISPGLKTATAVRSYSFMGLLGEVSPLHIGVRSPHMFECIMLPEQIDVSSSVWDEVRDMLSSHNFDVISHQVTDDDQRHCGVRFVVHDIRQVPSFSLFMSLVQVLQRAGIELSFAPTFDLATGTPLIRQLFAGEVDFYEVATTINQGLADFTTKATEILLYDWPLQPVYLRT